MHKTVKFLYTRKSPLTHMDTKLPRCKLTTACAAPTYAMLLSKVLLAYHRNEPCHPPWLSEACCHRGFQSLSS